MWQHGICSPLIAFSEKSAGCEKFIKVVIEDSLGVILRRELLKAVSW